MSLFHFPLSTFHIFLYFCNMNVTIITVCRNHAKELEKTIRSVESQTWQDKEYLIIDGASTDETMKVIQQHEASITKWISEPDHGIYDAMNKGVKWAQGQWVIFMNAGDTFASTDTLQRVFQVPQEADVIYGDVIKGETVKKAEAPHNAHRMFFCHQSAFVKTSCLKEFPFDTRHRMSADFKQIKQLYLSGKTFRQLDFPVANFDTQGVSNTNRSAGLYDNIQVIRETDGLWEQVRLLPRLYLTYLVCTIRGRLKVERERRTPLFSRKWKYMLHSGKNSKLAYYVKSYLRLWTPRWLTQRQLPGLLQAFDHRTDQEEILRRVNYYNHLTPDSPINQDLWTEKAIKLCDQPMTKQKTYYLDAMAYARFFDPQSRWILLYGDITYVPELPTILKSRPLGEGTQNSVLLNLDKVRHFLFVNDQKPWREKKDMAIFRGDLGILKENRNIFMRRFANGQSKLVDAASTNLWEEHPEWQKDKLTIGEHLDYKFIMSLEGNDVASNLKWVMSSNSIAVTPRLTCETWFMEGTLKANYHYIEVKDDFSDLEERLTYYIEHPDEAEAIIEHAHEYVAQFQDEERERLISLMVLKKYFEITNKP